MIDLHTHVAPLSTPFLDRYPKGSSCDKSDARRELMPETVAAYARRLSFDPLLFDAGLLTALVDVVAPTL